jgi:hypothetical protein
MPLDKDGQDDGLQVHGEGENARSFHERHHAVSRVHPVDTLGRLERRDAWKTRSGSRGEHHEDEDDEGIDRTPRADFT